MTGLARVARQYSTRFPHRGTGCLLRKLFPYAGPRARGSVVSIRFLGSYSLEVDTSTYVGWYLFFYGAYNPASLSLVRRSLPERGVAVDIGAGIGDFSIAMADAVGPEGTVHAFEPSQVEYAKLVRNMALNHLAHVTPYRAAVADQSRTGQFFNFEGPNSSRGSLVNTALDPATVPAECPVVSLDDLSGRWPRLDLIKIDAQGADLLVLRGAVGSLRRWRPLLMFNAMSDPLYECYGTSTQDIVRFLADESYEMEWLRRPQGSRTASGVARPDARTLPA